jgi:hypothetical protein
VHRVVWATPATRIDWVRDEEALEVASAAGALPGADRNRLESLRRRLRSWSL